MEQNHSIDELLSLYKEAVQVGNEEAKEIISKAILQFSEMQSLKEGISAKFIIAHRIIHGGSV